MNLITLYINSKDRMNIPSASPSNFRYLLSPIGIRGCIGYYIKTATIPLSIYVTVTEGVDPITGLRQNFQKICTLNDPITGLQSITIPAGNYSATRIAQLIQNAFNAVGGIVYAVSYNPDDNKITISSTMAFDIAWSDNTAQYQYNCCGVLLGWRDENYNPIDISGSSTYTAPYQVSLSGPLNYYIKSQALSVGTNSFFQGIKSNVICCIPNNNPPYDVLIYSNQSPDFDDLNNINFNTIDIRLTDEYGNDVILYDDWQFVLVLKIS